MTNSTKNKKKPIAPRKNSIFAKIRNVVKKIPPGKVAIYGQIAKLAGTNARVVGWAMHGNSDPQVPCHRVVNAKGAVAQNYAFEGWREQKRRLLKEDITFKNQKEVDLDKHLWLPYH